MKKILTALAVRFTSRQMLLAGGTASLVVLGIIYSFQVVPVREEVLALRAQAVTLSASAGTPSAEQNLSDIDQNWQALRQSNRALIADLGRDEGRVILSLLSRIDDLIAASGMLLVSREDPGAMPRPVPRLPQGMQLPVVKTPKPVENLTKNLPADITVSAYRHTVVGDYHRALQLLEWLDVLEAPCRIRHVLLKTREVRDSHGGLEMEFTVSVVHGK